MDERLSSMINSYSQSERERETLSVLPLPLAHCMLSGPVKC